MSPPPSLPNKATVTIQWTTSKTWRAGLTLALEGSGSLATLHLIHEHLLLWSGSQRGCRMSENKRWEVVQQTSSLCVRYIWPQYLTTKTQTLCISLSVSGVEDYKHITMTTCRNDNKNDVMGVRNIWTPWETLQVSPHPLPKNGMGLKQGYTLPKK